MAQTDSIVDLLKTLCWHNSYQWETGFRCPQKLYSTVYSILLKFHPAIQFLRPSEKNEFQFTDRDYVYSEVFNLQLTNKTSKAQKLSMLIHSLEDQDGNLCDDTASCLRLLFCLSKFTAKEKTEDVFQYHVDPYQRSEVDPYHFKFQYKSYPSSLFEESHYPALESAEYNSRLFETVEENAWCRVHKKFFTQSSVSSAYGCFGAFGTSRKNKLNTTLELPLLSDSQLDRPTFQRLRTVIDKSSIADGNDSEDEGFVDPYAKSKAEKYLSSDIWEKVCKMQPKRSLSWDYRNDATGYSCQNEKQFLSHSGPESTQVIHASHQQNLHFLDPALQPSSVKTYTPLKLLTDCIHLLLAVESATFQYDKSIRSFVMQFEVQIAGLTPESIHHMLKDMMECGTNCKRLEMFATYADTKKGGHIFSSFKEGLRQYLQYYRGAVLCISENHGHSVMQLHSFMSNIAKQIRFICEKFFLTEPNKTAKLPTGLRLVDYIYQQCVEHWGSPNYLILLFLLKTTSVPYIRFLQDWLFEGVCNDPFSEFSIRVNRHYVLSRNENFWSKAFIPVNVNWLSPFLKETSMIVTCGKALNLLRICCSEHCLLNEQDKRPVLSFSLSKRSLQKLSDGNKAYLETMMTILELQQCIKEALAEKKKLQEHKRVLEARHAAAARYRLQREFRKTQMRELKVKQNEYCKKLNEQIEENRLIAANDGEEHKASNDEEELRVKDEMALHYAKLIDAANLKQQKFEWQVKRLQLHEKRQQFFRADEEDWLSNLNRLSTGILKEDSIKMDLNLTGAIKEDLNNTAARESVTENEGLSVVTDDGRETCFTEDADATESNHVDLERSDLRSQFLELVSPEDVQSTEEFRDNLKENAKSDGTANLKADDRGDVSIRIKNEDLQGKQSECIVSKPQPYEVDSAQLIGMPGQEFIKRLPKASDLLRNFADDSEDAEFLQQIPLPVLLEKSFHPAIHAQ